MSKLYEFRFTARKAEFSRGFVIVALGASSDLGSETRLCTFADALAYLREFSASHQTEPHQASLSMRYRAERCPPGFKAAKKVIEFNPTPRESFY